MVHKISYDMEFQSGIARLEFYIMFNGFAENATLRTAISKILPTVERFV